MGQGARTSEPQFMLLSIVINVRIEIVTSQKEYMQRSEAMGDHIENHSSSSSFLNLT